QNVLINSMTRLKHFSCPIESETGLGSKEESTTQKEDTLAMISLVSDQKLEQGGFESLPFTSTNVEGQFLVSRTSHLKDPLKPTTSGQEKMPKMILRSKSGYQRTISVTTDINVTCSMFSFEYKTTNIGILNLSLLSCYDPGVS